MAVRTELVREFLIDRVFGEVEERYPGEVSDQAAAALARAGESVLAAGALSAEAPEAATELARRGYLTRVVETELFDRARQPLGELRARLAERDADSLESAVDLSAELALAEPADKPAPGGEAWTSWRIPGPGGHVRHLLALMGVSLLFPKGPEDTRPLPAGVGEGDLKRCWMYGFYVRCCEEALASDA